MTSDFTGEIRCPSCGRTTPLAPFCTHCGAVIPEGAGAPRPHAMGRDELEERARQLRGGGSPFRRGSPESPEPAVGGWSPPHAPQAFVPEPADAVARQGEAQHGDEPAPRVDNFDERAAAPPPPSPPPPPAAPPQQQAAPSPYQASAAARYEEIRERFQAARREEREPPPTPGTGEDGGYGYGGAHGDDEGWDDDGGPPRRSSALPILGFLVLGVAALLGGAVLFTALNASPGVAEQTGSPSTTASGGASPSASEQASGGSSASPSASEQASSSPVADNFSARAQPCATSKMGFSGCDQDGTTLTGDQVWVWVGFKNGQAQNVLGVTIVSSSGTPVADGSLQLDKLTGCDQGKPCSGYIKMNFGNLDPGSYTIQVTRDGNQVATSGFTVKA